MQGLEPALDGTLTKHLIRTCRFGEAFQFDGPEIAVFKEVTQKSSSDLSNHHCVRLGKCLQPRGEVRRLADNCLFLRGTRSYQVTDDHDPRGNTYPRREPAFRLDGTNGVRQLQPCAHRSLGIILLSLRVTEVGQDAIAHVFSDKAIMSAYRFGNALMIRTIHLAQVLRVEARSERGRANEIAEHHRELSSLGAIRGRRSGHDRKRLSGALAYRFAATTAEPRCDVVFETTGWAQRRKRRPALRAIAPSCHVFGHATRAAHGVVLKRARSHFTITKEHSI